MKKLTKISFLAFVYLTICCSSASIQKPKKVTGVIYDDLGILPGINVTILRTYKGVQSDMDGRFQIEVSEGDVLEIFSSLHQPKRVKITTSTYYKIKLEESVIILD